MKVIVGRVGTAGAGRALSAGGWLQNGLETKWWWRSEKDRWQKMRVVGSDRWLVFIQGRDTEENATLYEWEWIVIQLIESFGYEYVFAQPAPALLSPKPKGCIPVILPLGIYLTLTYHTCSSNELKAAGRQSREQTPATSS